MNTHLKRRYVSALLVGLMTTGTVSFVLLAHNLGFSDGFVLAWLRSWSIGYAIAVPSALWIHPRLQARLERLIV